MISSTAGRCLDFINAPALVKRRRPDGPAGLEWDRTISEVRFKVIEIHLEGGDLETLLMGLQEEWFCYLGEQAALKMGLATRRLLDAP